MCAVNYFGIMIKESNWEHLAQLLGQLPSQWSGARFEIDIKFGTARQCRNLINAESGVWHSWFYGYNNNTTVAGALMKFKYCTRRHAGIKPAREILRAREMTTRAFEWDAIPRRWPFSSEKLKSDQLYMPLLRTLLPLIIRSASGCE